MNNIGKYYKGWVPESHNFYDAMKVGDWHFESRGGCGYLAAGELGVSTKEVPRGAPVFNWNSAPEPYSWLKFLKDETKEVDTNICIARYYTEGKHCKSFVSNKNRIVLITLGNTRRLVFRNGSEKCNSSTSSNGYEATSNGSEKTEIQMSCGDMILLNSGTEWSVPATKREGDTIILEFKTV